MTQRRVLYQARGTGRHQLKEKSTIMKRLPRTCGCLVALALTALSMNCSRRRQRMGLALRRHDAERLDQGRKSRQQLGGQGRLHRRHAASRRCCTAPKATRTSSSEPSSRSTTTATPASISAARRPTATSARATRPRWTAPTATRSGRDHSTRSFIFTIRLFPPTPGSRMRSRSSPRTFADSVIPHIKVSINGKLLYEFLDHSNTWTEGHFAFQQHDPGSRVEIRKIEVQELP